MPDSDIQRLVERIEAATPESAEREYLGIAVNEALGIASYITDDGDPTQSIDAAMTLVPTEPYAELRPGQWWWMIEAWPNEKTAHVAYENGDSGIPEFSGKGATPALALCAAALRARITERTNHE